MTRVKIPQISTIGYLEIIRLPKATLDRSAFTLSSVRALMEDSAPSFQLRLTLESAIQRAFEIRRPILTHLNADTTWLLQLPYPANSKQRKGRSRYNIVLDPWLRGPQSDVAAWFSKQWHATESSVQTVSELQARLKDIDESERSHKTPFRKYEHPKKRRRVDKSWIDAIVISHEFTDHCNKETLLEFPSTTPVFATSKAAILIRSWNYFDAVQDVPTFAPQDPDWRKTSIKPLPQWLGISRIVTESDSLYYHSAILITFNLNSGHQRKSSEEAEQGEALIYTPHGIQPRDLCYLPLAKPRVNTLALLHGLHDITINPFKQLNLGAHNGLQAQRTCGAKYWISTHDEVKTGGGVIALFLKRKAISLQQAMEREREEKGDISDESIFADIKGVTFADLGNGESILLE